MQLTIDDARRPAEPSEFGYLLLALLTLSGWQSVVTRPFAGLDETGEHRAEVLAIATRGPLEVRRIGASVAEIAPALFGEAMRLQGRVLAA